MNKKFIWLIVSCLMVAALVLASCRAPVEKEEVEVEEKVGPQYGGIVTMTGNFDIQTWDFLDGNWTTNIGRSFTNDTLMCADWWDREITDYTSTNDCREPATWTGLLTESWEQPDPQTLIYHLRKGVSWQDKDPVNGREFVAEDVKYHFERLLAAPKFADHPLQRVGSIECPDKYTVVVKSEQPFIEAIDYLSFLLQCRITAHEEVDIYGDMRDWRNVVGTGPFILEDHLPSSSISYSRNPLYFVKDPEGRQIPYVDGVKMLVIVDPSTRIAAIRTGKVDYQTPHRPISWEEKSSLEVTNPELQWGKSLPGLLYEFYGNVDEEPFSDIRVRQALHMAFNRQELIDSLFGGEGVNFNWPARPGWGCFTPYDELPEHVKEVVTYDPEKAKQRLAETKWPNGFKTSVQYTTEGPFGTMVTDMLQLVQRDWAEIGVELELRPVEYAVLMSLVQPPFAYGQMVATSGGYDTPLIMLDVQFTTTGYRNTARVSDPYFEEQFTKASEALDVTERNEILKELFLYLTEQTYFIGMPIPYGYSVWQPWVKGYHGEQWLDIHGYGGPAARIWLDQDLRKEMVGR